MSFSAIAPVANDFISDEISFASPNRKQTIISVTSVVANGQTTYTIVGDTTTFVVSAFNLVLEYVRASGLQKWVVGK